MTANQWMKTPKGYVAASMVFFLLIASFWSQDISGIYNGLIAVGVSSAADMICSRIAKRKRFMPDGAVITGLIIALILGTTSPWYMVAGTSIMAILSKHLLVYKKKPIFNPAAFGLLLSILFFRSGQSWWGAFGDLPAWSVVFLLIGGYMVTNRVNKFPQVFSFLGTYFILLLIMGILNVGDATDALRSPFINASLFFALFMLTDPPTSPAKVKDQVIFGILSAVVGAVIYGIFGGLMYLFIGLLVGNLYHILVPKFRNAAIIKPVSQSR
ncbi:RnfABCDGE type electron transport complex subunit D [Paenibacillus frigoriresistens]|uniref:RnfABCDGE type electron transport complex subunit D n=1 Tax=Paenibacillus alginolyticus TaxID=59839 RepID=UPI00156669BD|nr:RnfABCDGE type electron transport complex subunit D [Paenibacillus frigoriresistens]NRF91658.1 RnfABCDGE type electron transport complex subunit D [Paenibacillus frigoriresistens]